MNNTHKTYDLIQSLTKSEKRYFKLFAKRTDTTQGKNYLKLFAILEQLQDYEENVIIKKLEKQGLPTKFLAADKNYLHKLILESLRNFHSSRTGGLKVKEILINIEILYQKGLIKQCLQELRKAKKTAQQYQLPYLLLEVLHWEQRILGQPNTLKLVDQHYQKTSQQVQTARDYTEYTLLYRKANLLRKKLGKVRNIDALSGFDVILNHELMQGFPNDAQLINQLRYYQILGTYYYCKDDWKAEYQNSKNLVELMSSNWNFVEEYPFDYVAMYSRLLILTKKANPDNYDACLNEFRTLPDSIKRNHQKVAAQVFSLYHSTELVRLIDTGHYTEAEALIPEIIKGLEQFKALIDEAFKISFYYKFAYIYIGVNDCSKALDYVNIVLSDYTEKTRPDIYSFAKILSLIVHLELGNISLLSYISQSAEIHLHKRNRLFKSERVFLRFMKRLPLKLSPSVLKKELLQLKSELVVLFEDSNERKILDYFDLLTWIDSKIEGKSFEETKQKLHL